MIIFEIGSLQMWRVMARSHWSRVNPWFNAAGVLIKGGNLDTDVGAHKGGATWGGRWAQEWGFPKSRDTPQRSPAPPEARWQAWARAPLTALRTNRPTDTLTSHLWPPEWRDNQSLLFKPLGLWYCATAALASKCILAVIFNLKF